MLWEKSVPTSFVSESGISEFGQMRPDCILWRRTAIEFLKITQNDM